MKKGIFWAVALAVVALMIYHHVTAPAGPPGFVKLVPSNTTVELESRDRRYTVSSGKEPTKIPKGIYTIREISLHQEGYELAGRDYFGELTPVTVTENKTTVIDCGLPLLVKADVSYLRGDTITIGVNVYGKVGEKYASTATRYGVHLAAPKLKILDETGKVLAAGSFEFG
jgi:hypothetical protein